MNFDAAQEELNKYFSSNIILRVFVPISDVLFIGGQIILIIFGFGMNFGIIITLIEIIVIASMIITLAKGNYKNLAIGLGLRTLMYLISLIKTTFDKNNSLELGYIIYMLIFGYATYLAYKKYLLKISF